MSLTIGAIVYARDAEEARGLADFIFEGLVGHERPFEQYEILADKIFRANQLEGKNWISHLMNITQSHFFQNLRELRSGLSQLTDEQAFSKMGDDIRVAAYRIGAEYGHEIRLYGTYGEGIRTPESLQVIFEEAPRIHSGVMEWRPEEESYSGNVWIVLAEVV